MSHASAATAPYDVQALRAQFPVLHTQARGKPLVYLDNGATTQKPLVVLDALDGFLRQRYGTIHRGVYQLSERATAEYEHSRLVAQRFLNAPSQDEIIFTSGTTDGLNLLATSFGRGWLREGDEILLSAMEHHANIVPWQLLRDEKGVTLNVIPMNEAGVLDQAAYARLLGPRTRVVSVTHVSNVLGTVNPVAHMARLAHEAGAVMVVDGAQSAAHTDIDVQALGADFFVFSGHKIYGPTGVGVLWGRMEHLERMAPYRGGGDMIVSVTFEKTEFARPPARFEAGTPPVAEVIGLGAAMQFLLDIGRENIARHEDALLRQTMQGLLQIPGLKLVGTAPHKSGAVSFYLQDAHPHDIATLLDGEGIAIRAGHHCAQPVMDFYGLPATARASMGLYNTPQEIETLVGAVEKVQAMFA